MQGLRLREEDGGANGRRRIAHAELVLGNPILPGWYADPAGRFDLRYWDTDEHSFGSIYKSRVVIGIKATFP